MLFVCHYNFIIFTLDKVVGVIILYFFCTCLRVFHLSCRTRHTLQTTVRLNIVHVYVIFTTIILMASNIHTQLVAAIGLLDCIIPNHIILTALTRPNRQLHCLHTLGRADIRHHHIKALRSFILNVNRASHLNRLRSFFIC